MKPIKLTPTNQRLLIELAGDWQLARVNQYVQLIKKTLAQHPTIKKISFDTEQLTHWDSTLIAILHRLQKIAAASAVTIDWQTVPTGMQQILALADTPQAVVEASSRKNWHVFAVLGQYSLDFVNYIALLLSFVGELVKSVMRFCTGRATFSYQEFIYTLYYAGPKSLAAIGIIGFMLGSALAFGGLKPLQLVGQEIWVANVIGYGIVRQAAPIFTAIFLLVRLGAGMTGDMSSMQEQHQMDAFRVNLISPMDYLVLPRLFGVMIAAPLLCLYVDLVGVFGGWLTSVWYFDVNLYRLQTQLVTAFNATDLIVGIIKCLMLSIIVVIISCQRGLAFVQKKQTVTETVAGTLMIGLIALFLVNVMLDYLFAQLQF